MRVWHLLLALLLAIFALPIAYVWGTRHEVMGYVTSTERDGERKYIYLDAPPGMLYNDDSLLALKTNSGTLQGQIPEKEVCSFSVYGWRFPPLSMAPNILSAECERT